MSTEITINKLVFGGAGMGLLAGKVCFVENTVAGEKVIVHIIQNKKNYSKAELLQVSEASPQRVQPPCPYVRQCGGCQYQHIAYNEELFWKENQVREGFQKALNIDPSLVRTIRYGPQDYRYRSSVTLHAFSGQPGKPRHLGFIGRDNRSVIPVNDCLLADQRLKDVFSSGHEMQKAATDLTFKITQDGSIVTSAAKTLYPVKVGNESIWANSCGFFQNNLEVTRLIADSLREAIDLIQPECFLDLYAGAGTFSILCAPGECETVCFEENPFSIEALRKNIAEKNLGRIQIIPGRVEHNFPSFTSTRRKEKTCIFMDPPRQGIDKSLANFFAHKTSAGNIFFLACDLAILLRDLKIMLSGGRWRIREVIPFDMFPRTKHIEILTALEPAG